MTNPPSSTPLTLALGLVYRPSGTASADRSWARALVVRQCRRSKLTLVEVYELDDDDRRTADVLARLRDLAIAARVEVLVTDGVRPALAVRLVADLGARHDVVHRAPTPALVDD